MMMWNYFQVQDGNRGDRTGKLTTEVAFITEKQTEANDENQSEEEQWLSGDEARQTDELQTDIEQDNVEDVPETVSDQNEVHGVEGDGRESEVTEGRKSDAEDEGDAISIEVTVRDKREEGRSVTFSVDPDDGVVLHHGDD